MDEDGKKQEFELDVFEKFIYKARGSCKSESLNLMFKRDLDWIESEGPYANLSVTKDRFQRLKTKVFALIQGTFCVSLEPDNCSLWNLIGYFDFAFYSTMYKFKTVYFVFITAKSFFTQRPDIFIFSTNFWQAKTI